VEFSLSDERVHESKVFKGLREGRKGKDMGKDMAEASFFKAEFGERVMARRKGGKGVRQG